MIRATLALFNRSMQMESRAFRTYLLRVLLLGVMIMAVMIVHDSVHWYDTPGLFLFQWIIFTNAGFVTLIGLSFFSSVITEEKEEQTLGLLRMTKLNAVSILLGKSTTRLMSAIIMLLAQIPFTLLAITLGGVSFSQIVAAYIALIAFTIFMANLALLFSVVCRRMAVASFMTGLFLVLLFVAPGFFFLVITGLGFGGWSPPPLIGMIHQWIGDWLIPATPIDRLIRIGVLDFEETAVDALLHYHTLFNVIGGATLFIASWALFEPCCRNETDSVETRPFNVKFWKKTERLTERELRRPWRNAVAWKDFFFVTGGTRSLWFKCAFYVLLFVGFYIFFDRIVRLNMRQRAFPVDEYAGTLMVIFMIVFAAELGYYLSAMFVSEIKQRTFSTLALLPLSAGSLAYRKAAGCLTATIPTVIAFLLAAAISPKLLAELWDDLQRNDDGWIMIGFFLAAGIMFFHLSAYLSLFLKWGPFVMALGLTIFGLMMTGWVISVGFGIRRDQEIFFALSIIAAILSVALHVLIPLRLKAVFAH